MERPQFWEIIEASRRQARGDQAVQLKALAAELRHLSLDELVRFTDHCCECIRRADRNDIYAAAAIIDGFWVSDDAFTYFLEWLISQGERVYEDTLANPDSLADVVEKGAVCDFEGFGWMAARIWEERTGRSSEHIPIQRGSEARAPEGPAWKDDEDLMQRFPRLWAKFSEK
jgi:uncharacterized protein DUF4240